MSLWPATERAAFRLAADEDLKRPLVIALRRRIPGLDIETVSEAGLQGLGDPEVLAWAAASDRVLLTHDARTMPHHTGARIGSREPCPGVVIVPMKLAISRAVEDLELLFTASHPDELRDRILYLPI